MSALPRKPGAAPAPPAADTVVVARRVVVRGLEIGARVGIHAHERDRTQRVRIDIELAVEVAPIRDRLEDAVSYETVVDTVKALVAAGHINLAETLAERVADACLADPRVASAWVRVEKLAAVHGAAGVGAEVSKARAPPVRP